MSEDDDYFRVIFIFLSVLFLIALCCHFFLKPEPPIDVSFRESLMFDGKVLQVENTTTDKHLSCLMTVRNDTKHQEKTFSFTLSPSETQEVGMLEIDWAFLTGESVKIEVEGFSTYRCEVP